MKPNVFIILSLLCGASVAFATLAHAADEGKPSLSPESPHWSKATLRLAAELPIQDGGRLKPLDTYARFKLLKLNGSRSFHGPDGKERSALEWLLDCLFFPEFAKECKVFRVDNSDTLFAMDLEPAQKRGRYSYEDLSPGCDKLFSLASQYAAIPRDQQSPAQSQLINLAHNVNEFEQLTSQLDFARQTFPPEKAEVIKDLLPKQQSYGASDILRHASELVERLMALRSEGLTPEQQEERDAAVGLVSQLHNFGEHAGSMAILPPAAGGNGQWLTPVEAIDQVLTSQVSGSTQLELLGDLESLAKSRSDPDRFNEVLSGFSQQVTGIAKASGEYGKIPLEVTYYRAEFTYLSLCLYVFSFLLVAFSWLRPKSRILMWMSGAAVLIPTLILIAGITLRCIIRSRPPVTTLYETILFVTAVAVLSSLVIEALTKQKVGLTLGSLLGALGLFLAYKYEVQEGVDTMPSMVAVLNTNFWLATHVTTITVGYAAGLLAAAIAHVYVLGRLLGLKRNSPEFYSQLAGSVYGVFCFALIFSIVGTVLGGIWANESWGRFWGWDPKENGALMLVLWQLAVLHARGGNYIHEFGVALAAIFGGVIVAFSWFGVNLLGVGLHSYGFTSGVSRALMVFYVVESIVLLLGAAVWIWEEGLRMPAVEREALGENESLDTTAGLRPS